MKIKHLEINDTASILIFTDLHAHEYKKFNSPEPEGYGSRLKWVLTSLETIINYASKNSINHIFFLGDLLHHRTMLYSIVFDKVAELIKYGQEKNIEFHFILGNHDFIYNHNESPSILTRLEGVDIIAEPTIYKTIFPYNICCVPFRFDIETQQREIEELSTLSSDTTNNILFGHLELSGAHVNDEYILSSSLKNELFKNLNFSYVFTGHIHTRQTIIVQRDTSNAVIEYVGVPIQHTFNEENKDYGFTVLELLSQTPNYINLSSLRNFPEFNTFDFNTQDDIKSFLANNKSKLQLNYYRFKAYNTDLRTEKLFKETKYYTYECFVNRTITNSEEEPLNEPDYSFHLDFDHYLLLFLQQEERMADYSWFDMEQAQLVLDEIYQRGNICLK